MYSPIAFRFASFPWYGLAWRVREHRQATSVGDGGVRGAIRTST